MAVGGPNLAGVTTGGATGVATMKGGTLAVGQCASGDNAVYTVGAGALVKLATIALANVSAAGVVVTVSITPSGGTARTLVTFTLPPGEVICHEDVLACLRGLLLAPGDAIGVNAAAATAVNYVLTGTVAT